MLYSTGKSKRNQYVLSVYNLEKAVQDEIDNLSRSTVSDIEEATKTLPTKNGQVQIHSLMVFTGPSRTNADASQTGP